MSHPLKECKLFRKWYKRDTEAATRFLSKALSQGHSHAPRVIDTDKDKAYPKAIKDLIESGLLPDSVEHRAVKYLNNLIEQAHRFIKLRIITSQNFREFQSANKTISGYESMNMIRKGQIKNVKRDDVSCQIRFIHSLFGIAV